MAPRGRKPKVPKLDAASTAVDNTTLSEETNADNAVRSPRVTRSSKLKATKGLPESSNPSGGDTIMENVSAEASDKGKQIVGNSGTVSSGGIVIKENVPVEASDKGKQIVGSSGTVSSRGIVIKENVPVEASDKGKQIVGTSGSVPGSEHLTTEEKIDFLVQSVQEFKTKGIKQQVVNIDQPSAFDFKGQYLRSQKQVDALTKKNQDLSTRLTSALAKLEAYEKMNPLGQMNEAMTSASLTKTTEAFVTYTSQLTSGTGGPLRLEPPREGTSTNPPVAAQQTVSLPQATATDQGTSAELESVRRSTRQMKKKGG